MTIGRSDARITYSAPCPHCGARKRLYYAPAGDPALGRRLRVVRQWHGLSQADLADLVGCSQRTISCAERGTRRVLPGLVEFIAEALSLTEAEVRGLAPIPGMDNKRREPLKRWDAHEKATRRRKRAKAA